MLVLATDTQEQQQGAVGERRRGLRIHQLRPVKVFEPTTARYYGGQTQDVSTTGLRLELPAGAMLRPGKIISVHVGLSDAGQPLAHRRSMIPARIVWIDRRPGPGAKVAAGIEFMPSIAAHLDAA
jgi:hypothetical protein